MRRNAQQSTSSSVRKLAFANRDAVQKSQYRKNAIDVKNAMRFVETMVTPHHSPRRKMVKKKFYILNLTTGFETLPDFVITNSLLESCGSSSVTSG